MERTNKFIRWDGFWLDFTFRKSRSDDEKHPKGPVRVNSDNQGMNGTELRVSRGERAGEMGNVLESGVRKLCFASAVVRKQFGGNAETKISIRRSC